VIFTDDSSRKVQIYFLKHKLDVFDMFKKWVAQVENESGWKLKCLKFDDGNKYCDDKFEEFYASRAIRRVKAILKISHQNGVAKLMKRRILEHAWSMRYTLDYPSSFG